MEGKLIHAFIKRKERRMMREKNKSTSPSHTFPFAIKLSKSIYALGRFRNKAELIPRGFPSAPLLIFSNFYHLRHVEENLHRLEYGN